MPAQLPPIPGEFGELFASFTRHLRSLGRSPRTIESYHEGVARMVSFTGVKRADDLTTAQLRDWLSHEFEVTAPGSVGVRYRSVRAFIRWCYSEGELEKNPIAGIPAPTQPDNPVPVLTMEDLRKLLSVTDGTDWRSRRDRALVLFMLDSGCRRAEVAGVEVDDVDMDRGEVVVLGKGGSRRIISLGATALAALDRWLRARRRLEGSDRHSALWIGDRGPLSSEGVRQVLMRLGRQAGVSIHAHQLRHTWAHELRASGMGDAELMALAGWKSAAMLSKYSRSAVGARAARSAQRHGAGGSTVNPNHHVRMRELRHGNGARVIAVLNHKRCGRWVADLNMADVGTIRGMITFACFRSFERGGSPRLPIFELRRGMDLRHDYMWWFIVFPQRDGTPLEVDEFGDLVCVNEDDEWDGVWLPHVADAGVIDVFCDKCRVDIPIECAQIRRFDGGPHPMERFR